MSLQKKVDTNTSSAYSKIIAVAFVLIIFTTFQAQSQYNRQRERQQAPPLRERIFFGGSFGLQLGTITNIEASPVIGLWLLPRLAVAAGPSYQFYKDPIGRTDLYGGRSYGRFMFIQDINKFIPVGMRIGFFVHGEYEALSLDADFWQLNGADASRIWEHTVFGGFGISQGMGMRSSVNISFLWPLNDTEYDIYSSPEIRIDFMF